MFALQTVPSPSRRAFSSLTFWSVIVGCLFLMPTALHTADGPGDARWLATVQRNLASAEYDISWQNRTPFADVPSAYQAPNRAHGIRTYFVPGGLRVVPRVGAGAAWVWQAEYVPPRQEGDGAERKASAPHIEKASALYGAKGQTLRIENAPSGLLFRWVVERPASPEGDGTSAALGLGGDLQPALSSGGGAVQFVCGTGGPAVLGLGSLRASDSSGRLLGVSFTGSSSLPGILAFRFDRAPSWPVTVEALLTSPSWTAEGDQASAQFGFCVGTAGDVNGDGYSDVIVGAPLHDNGQADEGRVCVYHGSASGLATSPAWTIDSGLAGAYLGYSVGTAGDVNGDGFSDVIVGAPHHANGEASEGQASVYLGGVSGLATVPCWTYESNQASAQFGFCVRTAGDVDGDGRCDVIVGAPYYSNGEASEGRAWVFLGTASGVAPAPSWTAESDQANAEFGGAVGSAGDVNGDGYADVIVSARYYSGGQSQEGRAYAYYGGPGGLSASPGWTVESNQGGALFGWSVGTAGDVNGDGYADVVVTAIYYWQSVYREGKAFVFHGSSTGLSASPAWTAVGGMYEVCFGISAGTAGDVNGDGFADIVIGSHYYPGGSNRLGRVYVYFGSSSGISTSPPWMTDGDQVSAWFGVSVGTAGDVNGDGYSDVIVGAPLYDNGQADEGKAWVYLGSPDGPGLSAWTTEGNQTSAYWGGGLASAGDVNGDGYDDFLVSSPYYDTGAGANSGKVALFWGSPTGPSTTPDWTYEGSQSGGALGVSVAGAGDVNGDGYADVLVGQHCYTNGQTWEGRALLFLGSSSGPGTTPDWTAESNSAYANMGLSVASAGDVDGDGYADVIVGAPTSWDCICAGRAYLFRGSASGLSTSPDWTATGAGARAYFGNCVGSAGDVNGDGYSDVFISEYSSSGNGGRVMVWLGSATGLGPSGTPSNADWTAANDGESEWFGWSASGAGDVNGDGYSDLLIGAPNHTNEQGNEGRARLYLGSSTGLLASAAWSAESDQAGTYMGYSVSGAGDINGDGYSDIMVGGYGFDGAAGADCGKTWVFNGSATGLGASPSWSAEGSQAGEYFGVKVAGAGDVNGDGFGDLLACAESFDNGESEEGRVALYLGGAGAGGGGRALKPQQRRYDGSAPIVQIGKSESRDGFRVAAMGRTPFGRGKVRLQAEVKPYGTAFSGSGLQASGWTDTGTGGAAMENTVTSLAAAGGYHWRARLLYDPVSLPLQPAGRWFSPPTNGWTEMDLRLISVADISIDSFTHAPEPVSSSQNLSYSVTVSNAGPDASDASVSIVLSPTGVGLTFVPGSSDARWSWDSGTKTLSASLGSLTGGGSTSLEAVFTLTGQGTIGAEATATSSVPDSDLANNAASATTTVCPIADLAITSFTELPDPVRVGNTLKYTVNLANHGPDSATVTATEVLMLTGAAATFSAAASDPRWVWDSGTKTLSASLGTMAGGATDALVAVFSVNAEGTIANHAAVSSALYDPTPADAATDLSTTASCAPGAFSLTYPAAGATGISTSFALDWQVSPGAQSYSLYFGTSDPPPLLAAGLLRTTYEVGSLSPSTTYYWNVEALTPCGSAPDMGGTRSFATSCIAQVGRWPDKPRGLLRSTAVNGNYAYAANGLTLAILDISTPSAPVVLRELDLPGDVDEGEMLVSGGFLYVPLTSTVGGTAELKIFSLADAGNPLEVGNYSGPGGFRGGMELAGTLLYAANSDAGLLILDVSDPSSPALVGTSPAPPDPPPAGYVEAARDVTLYNSGGTTYAYVGYYVAGVQVLDVTDPSAPILITTLPPGWSGPAELECVGRIGMTLVVGGAEGLRLYDLASPAAPALITTWVPPLSPEYYVEWASFSGSTAYVCDAYQGLEILDLSTPASPSLLGSRAGRANPMHVALAGTTALLAEDHAGLTVLDVSSPASISQFAVWDASEQVSLAILNLGSHDFVGRNSEGIGVLDVSAPSSPAEVATWPLRGYTSLSSAGNHLFVSDRSTQLFVLDVSTPTAPVQLGAYARRGISSTPSPDGHTLYYATGGWGLAILDITSPASPSLLGRWAHPEGCTDCSARSVALDLPRAYLADAAGGLRILDVSNPASPTLLASAPTTGSALGVAYSDGHALVLSATALEIFDVSAPASPALVSTLALPSNQGRLTVSGSVATVGAGAAGAILVDVSNPSAPSILHTVDTPGRAWEARVVGDALHVADAFGVVIESLTSCCSGPPAAPTLLSPADGATGLLSTPKLDWSDVPWALRYDLYLDTANPPVVKVGSGLALSASAQAVTPGVTYYWKVVAHSPCGETPSEVRSFTAEAPDLVIALAAEPERVLSTGPFLLSFDASNLGINRATGVQIAAYLTYPGGGTLTFDAGASDPAWLWDGDTKTLRATLGAMAPSDSRHLHAVFSATGTGTLGTSCQVGGAETDPNLPNNTAGITTTVAPLALGNRVWQDDDADGIQDAGESGLSGVVVDLYDGSYSWLARKLTDPSGAFSFSSLTYGGTYIVKFFLPSAEYAFSPKDQGSDDTADSDADPASGQTGLLTLTDGRDPVRWDCGMVSGALCITPDEALYISSVGQTSDGNHYPILNFMDPNQPSQVTGYHVYRTFNPALPHDEWPRVASDVVDMDQGSPNKQWIDSSGVSPPEGQVWYYEVSAYNHHCSSGAEGPW